MPTQLTDNEPAVCGECGADGLVRIVDADGSSQVCVLHAIGLITRAEQGTTLTVVIDTAIACPWCGAGSGHMPWCRGAR